MSYFQICCKDIVDSIIDYFYPDELLPFKDTLKLSSNQLELYYKRNVSKIPGPIEISISQLIDGFIDNLKYEIMSIRLLYDNKNKSKQSYL